MTEAAAAALVGTSSPQPIADTRVVVVCVSLWEKRGDWGAVTRARKEIRKSLGPSSARLLLQRNKIKENGIEKVKKPRED
jgi:hypothetical protein